jgi:hypothetical protein
MINMNRWQTEKIHVIDRLLPLHSVKTGFSLAICACVFRQCLLFYRQKARSLDSGFQRLALASTLADVC